MRQDPREKKRRPPTSPIEQDSVIAAHQNDLESLTIKGAKSIIGDTFGKYKVIEPIGRGGTAEVYKIFHPGFEVYQALKLLGSSSVAAASVKQAQIERFMREARVSAKLRHPNIVSVHDVGIEEGRYYLTMDLVTGSSLEGLLKKEKLPLHECLKIVSDIARALHYAHEEGVIHRDIKPGNIMLDDNRRALLMDFGMAKPVAMGASNLTQQGEILGTPSYMAPEQAQGRLDEIDARSDVYGLGGVLYKMLTKRPPVSGKTLMAILMSVAREDPIPPSESYPGLPEEVEKICLKALEKKPENRFQTAKEFADAIDAFLAGNQVTQVADYQPVIADNVAAPGQTQMPDEAFDTIISVRKGDDDKKRIGKYVIEKEIAHGGSGVVYLAEDTTLQRQVAIKVLLSGRHASDKEQQRFLTEARTLAKVSHPMLIEIYEVGVCDEGTFLVMEYIPGRDLEKIIKQDGAKLQKNIGYCSQIAERILTGIAHAHKNKILHRDLKPANILIHEKRLKITDFGIAQDFSEIKKGKPQGYVGTPLYSSPEQIQSKGRLDARSDVYSVGVILYQMLTQQLPFWGNNVVQIAQRIINSEPRAPRQFNPNIPRDLEIIILKAIEKRPRDRYASAREFALDLQRFRKGEAIKAVPPSLGNQLMRKIRRYPLVIAGVVLLSLLAVFTVFFSESQARSEEKLALLEKIDGFSKQIRAIDMGQGLGAKIEFDKRMERLGATIKATEGQLPQLVEEEEQRLAEEKKLQQAWQTFFIHQTVIHARYEIQRRSWQEADKKLTKLRELRLATKDEGLRQQLKNDIDELSRQLPFVEISFAISPSAAKFYAYQVESPSKRIGESPIAEGNTDDTARLLNITSYLLEIAKDGYFPVRLFVAKNQKEHSVKVQLRALDNRYRDMVYIPGGENIQLGTDRPMAGKFLSQQGNKTPRQIPLRRKNYTVKPFLIDRYEVTNLQYYEYLKHAQKEEKHPPHWQEGQIPPGTEHHPVANVSWQEAQQYAQYYGKDLPTDLQWELAAVATDGRDYPWGDDNAFLEKNGFACLWNYPETVPAATLLMDRSPYGVLHMAGNVIEWTKTSYRSKKGKFYVIRGGAFGVNQRILKRRSGIARWWQSMAEQQRDAKVGFRCVVNLDE